MSTRRIRPFFEMARDDINRSFYYHLKRIEDDVDVGSLTLASVEECLLRDMLP